MKKYLLLLFIFIQATTTQAIPVINIQQNPFVVYTGKYQMTIKGKTGYIEFSLINGQLMFTSLWDKQTHPVKHLSGDNFIMAGTDWSVKFIRNNVGKITGVVVMGTDHWIKVN